MNYYDIFPRMVPSDEVSEIRIHPRFEHAAFPSPDLMGVFCNPFDGLAKDGSYAQYSSKPDTHKAEEWHLDGGDLVIRHYFAGEQEYNIRVMLKKADNPNYLLTKEFRIYSLKNDLFALRPFKGDFHIHTTRSDGKECPCYVAARYRQKGFDFAAITDHREYKPSLEAIEYWKEFNLDFKLYPGEEVHAPDNPVHIVNFGGKFSVNAKFREDEEAYRREVQAILDGMQDKNPNVNNFAVAASEWVFDRIREGGGLAVFCHPYWYASQFVIDEGLTGAMFKRRKFDAFELIGGFYRHQFESNNMQVVRYYEEQAKGNKFPAIGLSDSHGTDQFLKGMEYAGSSDRDLFGWYYTIVLAKSNSALDIIEAVKNFNSAAVCAPSGDMPKIYGGFRMVKYASFLMREYFPMHAIYCEQEGALMLDHLAGEKKAAAALKLLNGRTADYREASFRK
ncbi:MAG: hypothetical protein PHW60_07125 [Kiritimatiellae bacterium]|nr:hypothetical protein [Kiritimatiellia bacterium]